MTDHGGCGRCFGDLGNCKASNDDSEYVEVDPTGRYGRCKDVLGKGAFKTVYMAFDQEDGIEVAWNQVQVQDVLQTPEDLDRLYSEVHLLKTLKHKNIIKFYHSWVDNETNNVNFITEIFTSGTLRQYRKRHKHVDLKAVKNWSRQILRGLLYLHSHDPPIIHRDLKCDNIFINGNQGEVKIGDLGLATILQHAHAARSVIGTPEFMAPELYEEEYTELVDIYSFGMCLLEMVTSDYPYSECTNAAQIYKKVTSGKRPEALKKVQDSEVCAFIEKCLATASKRLPARELLMDPFLQCEGSRESGESFPHIGRMIRKANELDDFAVFMEEPHGKSATVQISYKLKEMLPTFPDDCSYNSVGDLKSTAGSTTICKAMHPYQSREEHARSLDFRVKGKRREDDTVYLRLRIADPEGQVRNIHFPFDVESDTAMCVASEMVAELDLTDQDVTKIAEMIDAAILALVPEWQPGVAIDETCVDGEPLVDHFIGNVVEDEYSSMVSVFDPLTTISYEDSHGDKTSCPPRALTPEVLSTTRAEGIIYGRFEEVTYQCHRSEFPASGPTEQCTVSSESSDILKGEVDCGLTDCSSSAEGGPTLFEECVSVMDPIITDSCDTVAAFNELVESKRNSRPPSYLDTTWEGIVQVEPCLDFVALVSMSQKPQDEVMHRQGIVSLNLQPYASATTALNDLRDWDDDYDDKSAAQELSKLVLRHEQELRELQHKHEEALSELRNRWQLLKKGNID